MSTRPVSPLVESGLAELAAGALSGWVYTLVTQQPDLARRLGIVDGSRIRQWHLDLAMLGTASVAAGLAVPDAPASAQRALQVGAWTNAMAFLPMAFDRDMAQRPTFKAAAAASFVATTWGFCGLALHARRTRRTSR
ncbi:hypothetical protein [Nocardioides marmoraquaticus]